MQTKKKLKCNYCSKYFEQSTARNTYCSSECRKSNKKERAIVLAKLRLKSDYTKETYPKIKPYFLRRGLSISGTK